MMKVTIMHAHLGLLSVAMGKKYIRTHSCAKLLYNRPGLVYDAGPDHAGAGQHNFARVVTAGDH